MGRTLLLLLRPILRIAALAAGAFFLLPKLFGKAGSSLKSLFGGVDSAEDSISIKEYNAAVKAKRKQYDSDLKSLADERKLAEKELSGMYRGRKNSAEYKEARKALDADFASRRQDLWNDYTGTCRDLGRRAGIMSKEAAAAAVAEGPKSAAAAAAAVARERVSGKGAAPAAKDVAYDVTKHDVVPEQFKEMTGKRSLTKDERRQLAEFDREHGFNPSVSTSLQDQSVVRERNAFIGRMKAGSDFDMRRDFSRNAFASPVYKMDYTSGSGTKNAFVVRGETLSDNALTPKRGFQAAFENSFGGRAARSAAAVGGLSAFYDKNNIVDVEGREPDFYAVKDMDGKYKLMTREQVLDRQREFDLADGLVKDEGKGQGQGQRQEVPGDVVYMADAKTPDGKTVFYSRNVAGTMAALSKMFGEGADVRSMCEVRGLSEMPSPGVDAKTGNAVSYSRYYAVNEGGGAVLRSDRELAMQSNPDSVAAYNKAVEAVDRASVKMKAQGGVSGLEGDAVPHQGFLMRHNGEGVSIWGNGVFLGSLCMNALGGIMGGLDVQLTASGKDFRIGDTTLGQALSGNTDIGTAMDGLCNFMTSKGNMEMMRNSISLQNDMQQTLAQENAQARAMNMGEGLSLSAS